MSKPFNPQSTVFSNAMLDYIMPSVSPNAWKILCFAMRKTAGWQDLSTYSGRKESDIISISQFMEGCGIKSENTVREAIEECMESNYLLRTPDGQYGQSFRYRLNVDYELEDTPSKIEGGTTSKIEGETPSKIEETNSNSINSNKDYIARKKEYLESIAVSVAKGMLKGGDDSIGGYPEEIREVLLVFSELWNIKPPARNSKSSKAYWIEGGRELLDACAELGTNVLREVRKDFEQYMNTHHGAPPFTVSSPRSLVNPARAKAGMLRNYAQGPANFISPVTNSPELWIGGERYINGVKAPA